MKKLFIYLILAMVVINCQAQKDLYNKEKDKYINNILSTPIKSYEISKNNMFNYIDYTLLYEEIKIVVVHYLFKEYEQQDYWSFLCRRKNGEMIIIDSTLGIPEHKISNTTLERIKNICLNYKQK